MENKRIESEDRLKVEQILIEEEAKRAAFLREILKKQEAIYEALGVRIPA